MREIENINQITLLSPDYLGLIFYKASPRYVGENVFSPQEKVKKIGVFVNASIDEIVQKVQEYDLFGIQLHGEESTDYCRKLRSRLSLGENRIVVIKAFSIANTLENEDLKAYEEVVDFFLFDTKGENKGGNGIRFNWQILLDYNYSTPFFLSGGIGPGDVRAVKELFSDLEKTKREHLFYGIDVNSRFEKSPGYKDPEALKLFINELSE